MSGIGRDPLQRASESRAPIEGPALDAQRTHAVALSAPGFAVNAEIAAIARGETSLGRNARGQAVRLVQRRLAALGYDIGRAGADGWWGEFSMAGCRRFQQENGLRPTGTVDRATLVALDAAKVRQPVTASAKAVGVEAPQGGLEAAHFQRLINRLGLGRAVADGVITAEEAKDVGIALSALRVAAGKGGKAGAVDGYEELLAAAGSRLVAPVPRDKLFAPGMAGDYVVFAPRAFHEKLLPLMNHRALEGHKVALIDPSDVFAHYGQAGPEPLARFVKEARQRWAEPKPRYVMLVGDSRGEGPTVPTFRESAADKGHKFMWSKDFASDNRFGDMDGDGVPELAVGRLPVDSSEDLEKSVARIIGYEAVKNPGLWQARAALVDGDPAWGGFMNKVVDHFTRVELDAMPKSLASARISFNPSSKIGGDSTAAVHKLYEDGALYLSYVGHGGSGSVDGLSVTDVAHLQPKDGSPIVTFTACLTGSYDDETDSLTEEAVKGGAIAAIGASEISTPEVNAAWARTMGEEVLAGGAATVGDAMVNAKRRMSEGETTGVSGFVERVSNRAFGIARSLGLSDALGIPRPTRPSHMYLYNLMGDPATRVRRPQQIQNLRVKGEMRPGEAVPFSLTLPPGMSKGIAYVSIEKPLGKTVEKLEDPAAKGISPEESRARAERNARRYNERSVVTVAIPIENGRPAGPIPIPRGCPEGDYNLRIAVAGAESVAVGVVEGIEIER